MSRRPRGTPTAGKIGYVQLRLDPDEERELRAAAEANGRTLPAEVLHRVRGASNKREGSLEWGLAELVRIIADNALVFIDPQQDRAAFLGLVQSTFDKVLTEYLGAIDEDNGMTAGSIAPHLVFSMRAPAQGAAATDPDRSNPYVLAERRIGAALGLAPHGQSSTRQKEN